MRFTREQVSQSETPLRALVSEGTPETASQEVEPEDESLRLVCQSHYPKCRERTREDVERVQILHLDCTVVGAVVASWAPLVSARCSCKVSCSSKVDPRIAGLAHRTEAEVGMSSGSRIPSLEGIRW